MLQHVTLMTRIASLIVPLALFYGANALAESTAPQSVAVVPQVDVPSAPQPEPSATPPFHFTTRPLTLNLMLGLGTPVGGFGAIAEYSFTRRLAFGAGFGASWIDGDRARVLGPVQLGALARYRLILDEEANSAHGLDVVGAFSTGHYTYPALPGNDQSYDSEQAYWVQAALEYELLDRSGFRFAIGVGVAYLAATSDAQHNFSDAGPLTSTPRVFPAFDLVFGAGI